MEIRGALNSWKDEPPRHNPLTMLRLLRGIICILVLNLSAFMMIVYFGFLSAVVLRFFCNVHYSRKAISYFLGAWLALWPFLFEKINKTKVVFSGETVPMRERVLLIANHRTEVDWMYLWDFALRKGCLGYIKYVLKSSLMKLPVFGWGFHILEFISVERRWEVDELNMSKMLTSFRDPQDPLWLALFPEGTDYTEQKCKRSQQYASENGLPILENVLLPKTKGFYACLEHLRGSLDAVYDVTIAYKPQSPSLVDNVFGLNPAEVHIHVCRVELDKIPLTEDEVSSWLMTTFRQKDKLLSNFFRKGHFPRQGTEGDLSTIKCLVNFATVIALISMCTYFTFFSSIVFKVYVSLVCCYLSTATYFNLRPTPIFGTVKGFM